MSGVEASRMQLDLCKTLRVDNARRGKKPGQYAAWACVLVMFVVIFWQAQEALAAKSITPAATEAPAGTYHLDRAHGSLIFRVNHLGFSNYTARFTRFDAELHLDPANPAASSVTATIDPSSIETDYPDPAYDFNAQLQNQDWLDVAQFPQITFRSTRVELTGPNTAHITGGLALHGMTHPVTLDATFNGGYAGHPMDPMGARIGFSAHGSLMRSEFGIAIGVPPAGSTFGVGDMVEFVIEAEFTQPKADSEAPAQ